MNGNGLTSACRDHLESREAVVMDLIWTTASRREGLQWVDFFPSRQAEVAQKRSYSPATAQGTFSTESVEAAHHGR